MIWSILRSVAAIATGLIVAMVLIMVVEVVCGFFHPFPPGVNPRDYEVCKAHVAKFPHWVLAIALIGWSVTVFVSSWVATRLGAGRHPAHGVASGAILLSAASIYTSLLAYPLWFELTNLVAISLAIFASMVVGRPLPSQPAIVESVLVDGTDNIGS